MGHTPPLIDALAAAQGASVVETQISWVLLAPTLAYKIRKPIMLPFLDYSTLQAREHCCDEEVRLNGLFAPALRSRKLTVTGTLHAPVLDGPGPALEHAVCMRRFEDGALLARRAAAGTLVDADVDALATWLADRHAGAKRADMRSLNTSAVHRHQDAMNLLDGAHPWTSANDVSALRAWLLNESLALAPLWRDRLAGGQVRECHGDLHLNNLLLLDGGIAALDAVEFDPALRRIDVIDDAAFVVMDLDAHGRSDLAFRFLNAWLDLTGDHKGLPALRFAVVCRALVRAQALGLRGDGAGAQRYVATAMRWVRRRAPRLIAMHGLPGSGKTYRSQQLLQQQGAIRLRSDVERRRLYGLDVADHAPRAGLDLYGEVARRLTYARLITLARTALRSGYPVVLDAVFLRREDRRRALSLARELQVPLSIVECSAPLEVMRERLRARRGDTSQADIAVLEHLRADLEPLDPEERRLLEAPDCMAA